MQHIKLRDRADENENAAEGDKPENVPCAQVHVHGCQCVRAQGARVRDALQTLRSVEFPACPTTGVVTDGLFRRPGLEVGRA